MGGKPTRTPARRGEAAGRRLRAFLDPARAARYPLRMDWLGVDLEPALQHLYGRVPTDAQLVALRGDASSRRYYRLHVTGRVPDGAPATLIVMQLPADPLGSDEKTSERPGELPFLDVQRMLSTRGIAVPAVFHTDLTRRIVLLEDLGDETFHARLQRLPADAWMPDYRAAVELLAHMHRACDHGPADESVAFRRQFDRELLRWELDHFKEWGLDALDMQLTVEQRDTLATCFDQLADALLRIPVGFVHRDYQSKNLMWPSADRLVVIDFQDALRGPRPYDLVALLCDSYVALDAAQQSTLIDAYLQARDVPSPQHADFRREFWCVAAQRKLKDAGRFVFIDRVRGNADFLQWFPQTMRYVARALLQLPELAPVDRVLRAVMPGYPDDVRVPAAQTGSARQLM